MFKETLRDIFHLFYPNNCGVCNEHLTKGEEHICMSCLLSLSKTNFHSMQKSGLDQMFFGRFSYQKATAFYYFNKEGGMQEAMHGIKYLNNIYLAEYFGKLMAKELKNWLADIDVLIPIPLAKKKESKRGYNQAYHLGKGISEQTGIEINEKAVARIRDTETQTKKTRAQRAENMKNAFEWVNTNEIAGKHVLLIDDVITTGATIESCVTSLPDNIDIKISILSLAVAIES